MNHKEEFDMLLRRSAKGGRKGKRADARIEKIVDSLRVVLLKGVGMKP